MKKFNYAFAFTLVLALSACSSSNKGEEPAAFEDEFAQEEIPLAEGESDVIPEESLEDPGSFGESMMDEQPAPLAEAEPAPLEDPVQPMADDTAYQPPVNQGGYPEAGGSAMGYGTGSGQFTEYTVQKGDTLMKIAFETYGDLYQWKKLYEANQDKLADPNNLPAGMVIRVEQPVASVAIDRNGEPYQIKPGDTLAKISTDVYGTPGKWRKVWDNNRQLIRDPNKIYAGFYVYYTFSSEDEQAKQQFLSQGGSTTDQALAPAPGAGQPMNPVDSERLPAAQ